MATLFVRHKVADYAAWRRVYDAAKPQQDAAGVLGAAIYRSVDDPNELTVSHDFASVESARAWAASPELHAALESAGVLGAPTVWFTNRA
jgi:antibiotic biosynthesis monooxygenase (ABM) superfamily enzyme